MPLWKWHSHTRSHAFMFCLFACSWNCVLNLKISHFIATKATGQWSNATTHNLYCRGEIKSSILRIFTWGAVVLCLFSHRNDMFMGLHVLIYYQPFGMCVCVLCQSRDEDAAFQRKHAAIIQLRHTPTPSNSRCSPLFIWLINYSLAFHMYRSACERARSKWFVQMIKLNEHNTAHKPQQTENAATPNENENEIERTNECWANMTCEKDIDVSFQVNKCIQIDLNVDRVLLRRHMHKSSW